MFWKKPGDTATLKLSRPGPIPQIVQKYLIEEKKMDPELPPLLKSIMLNENDGDNKIWIFDESDAVARKITVKDQTTINEHPELIIYEGSFNETAKKVSLEEKKATNIQTEILTEAEILSRIEALKEPGSTVFFYMARGPAHGGPLGMGAAVVELNPDFPNKQKKYKIYCADVVDMEPIGKGTYLWDSNKPKDITKWMKESHRKRVY